MSEISWTVKAFARNRIDDSADWGREPAAVLPAWLGDGGRLLMHAPPADTGLDAGAVPHSEAVHDVGPVSVDNDAMCGLTAVVTVVDDKALGHSALWHSP